jgi:Zn-dependent peptidase ImmA (M78 family)/transcriptional regulator with XRE-family HTH domain
MKVNPDMIVLARDLRGVTQSDLADGVSLTQSTISKYEGGLLDVPREHACAIAEFLRRPVSFLYWDEKPYDASCMYHRRNRRISAGELRMIHATVNLLRMQGARMLKKAKITSKYTFHRLDPAAHGGPEGCAATLRKLWQLPLGPVRNLVRLIESAGGIVFRCPFGDVRVDGISQWPLDDPAMPPVFFVHEAVPGDRERWTLAHEMGHVVMHHVPTDGDREDEANRFASAFLMPSDDIEDDLGGLTLAKAASLKSYWKVSMQAIIMRARQLGKITAASHEYLFRQLTAKRYRACEPVPIPPEEPELFGALLDFHRKPLGRGDAELREYLGELADAENSGHRHFSRVRLVS